MTTSHGTPPPTDQVAARSVPIARVLLVDDEPDLLEAYAAVLAEAGFETRTATSAEEALAALGQPLDVVVSDIVMPGLSGIDLLRRLRANDLDLPVVLVTANPRVDTAIRAVELGALEYLLKPVPEARLVEVVTRAARLGEAARLRRELLRRAGVEQLVADRLGLEVRFERALGELWMAYQPIVRASDHAVVAHEALLRCAEPDFPGATAVLDAAGRLGRTEELGRRVRAVIAERLAADPDGRYFVNLHPCELLDPELYAPDAPLSRTAARVVLEITERAALDGVADVAARIERLRGLGYQIAIDDLGAGYSGLSAFVSLAPDVVKLDMSLVRGCDRDPLKARLIAAIAAVASDLGIELVAEGIETEEERATAVGAGCSLLQGFFLGRPRAYSRPVATAAGGEE